MTDKHKGSADLAVKSAEALALDDALDLYEQMGGAGLENVSSNEITLPQIKILQPTSPAVAEGKGRPGEIFNTMSEENYGTSLAMIPLLFFVSRLKFKGTELNSGIECSSKQGMQGSQIDAEHGNGICAQCQFAQWTRVPGGQDQGPSCIEFKNILCVPMTSDSIHDNAPGVIAGKRKAIVPTNKMLTRASMLRVNGKPVPFFGSVWVLKTVQVKNDKGIFFVPEYAKGDYVTDRGTLGYLFQQYQAMKRVQDQFVIHDSASDDEAVNTETADF